MTPEEKAHARMLLQIAEKKFNTVQASFFALKQKLLADIGEVSLSPAQQREKDMKEFLQTLTKKKRKWGFW